MPTRIQNLLLVVVVALFGWPASAAERQVHEVLPARADGTVSIEIVSGSVRFSGWDRNEVQIEGTLQEDVEGLDIDSGDSHVSIEVDLVDSGGRLNRADAHLEIHVPSGSRFEAESVSADLTFESISGRVNVESVNGDVQIRGEVSEAEVSTVSSEITLETGAAFRDGDFQTVSGSVDFRGALAREARLNVESVSGDVTLRLDRSTAADFRVETFSGDIDNQLGPEARQSSPYVPAKTLSFSVGSGGARVTIESFSGKIHLLPR